MHYLVNSSRGQLKIQQMAFVLVAIMIFFAMVGLFYFSIKIADLKGSAQDLREDKVRETVRKMAGSPEFAWTASDCASCIDLDKVLALKERKVYEDFWDFSFLQISRVYPSEGEECTKLNYPRCGTITIIDKKENTIAHSAFVSLCRFDGVEEYSKCELGKIILGFESVK